MTKNNFTRVLIRLVAAVAALQFCMNDFPSCVLRNADEIYGVFISSHTLAPEFTVHCALCTHHIFGKIVSENSLLNDERCAD